MPYDKELALAHRWADEADSIALEHFKVGALTEIKDDGTPVTFGDRAVERALRRNIEREFPRDAILGEEEGETGDASRRWVIDPIDGTKNYARGIPVFATLLALQEGNDIVFGMVSAPGLGLRWWASAAGGAFCNAAPIRVSEVKELGEADLCTGGLDHAIQAERGDQALELMGRVRRHRGFGDFLGAMLVAQGSMDVMVEFAPLKLWDVAACDIIVHEAGGRATNMRGDREIGPSPMVSTNGTLHDEVLAMLGSG